MRKQMKVRIAKTATLFILAAAVLSGCGGAKDSKKATQVAARVNGDEITIHQINNTLARVPNVTPDQGPRVKREILDRLVNQQLAIQQAVEKKLDRTPTVVQAIEASKADILARAYMEQVASTVAKPGPEEIKKYYTEHPELFAQRHIFHLEEVITKYDAALPEQLNGIAAKATSMDAVAAYLANRKIPFARTERIAAAEELPIAALPRLSRMKPGDFHISENKDAIAVVRIVSSRLVPIDEAGATPRIERFLITQRANEAVSNEVKRLREVAKIEYLGEFAADAAPADTPAKSQAPQKTPDATTGFDKGLRGLK